MNARLPEELPSDQPDAPRVMSAETPTHQLLDDIMKGPRMWAKYFDEQVAVHFPDGGYDQQSEAAEATVLRKTLGQFKSYEYHWLKKYATQSAEHFRSLDLTDSDELRAYDELTFHLINQHVMPHWYRVFDQRGSSKPDERALNAAQIKLALESALLLKFKKEQEQEFEDSDYVNQQLADIDTMIAMLQVMIDAPYLDLESPLITPAPLVPAAAELRPGFLVFHPDYKQDLLMTRIYSDDLERSGVVTTPGRLAQIALARTKISSLSFWPEFNSREALHAFMSAKTGISQSLASDPAIEETRQQLGESLRVQLNQ